MNALSPPRPALVSGARRDLPVREQQRLPDRAPRGRQGRCRAHGDRRADPRRAPPARARHRAEARRHDRVAAGDRVLAAPCASSRRRSRRQPGAPAGAARRSGRARGDGDRRRPGALAGRRTRRLCRRSPAVRHAGDRRDLAPQGPERQARARALEGRRALSDALGPDRYAAAEFQPGPVHAGGDHHRRRAVGPRLRARGRSDISGRAIRSGANGWRCREPRSRSPPTSAPSR